VKQGELEFRRVEKVVTKKGKTQKVSVQRLEESEAVEKESSQTIAKVQAGAIDLQKEQEQKAKKLIVQRFFVCAVMHCHAIIFC
jgi:hypothetical protein